MEDITVLKPETSDKLEDYTKLLYNLRKEKGMTEEEAHKTALNYNYFGTLMVKAGDADGMVSGANHSTADTVRPALQIIKTKAGAKASARLTKKNYEVSKRIGKKAYKIATSEKAIYANVMLQKGVI